MQKISKKNKDFFLKWQPFNFCDRFCERCQDIKNDCPINTDDVRFKLECLREGKDPDDPKVACRHVKKIMLKALESLKNNLAKEGIKITAVEESVVNLKKFKPDKRLARITAHGCCQRAWNDLRMFLDEFNPLTLADPLPWAADFWKEEMEELFFYSPMIMVKADRALYSWMERKQDIRFRRPDYLVSGSLCYFSILTVEGSLERIKTLIKSDEPIWALRISQLLRILAEARQSVLDKFPQVKRYKNMIIFHGRS